VAGQSDFRGTLRIHTGCGRSVGGVVEVFWQHTRVSPTVPAGSRNPWSTRCPPFLRVPGRPLITHAHIRLPLVITGGSTLSRKSQRQRPERPPHAVQNSPSRSLSACPRSAPHAGTPRFPRPRTRQRPPGVFTPRASSVRDQFRPVEQGWWLRERSRGAQTKSSTDS
jgi:hypothetical protein